jgi:putative DNA primase/helicase
MQSIFERANAAGITHIQEWVPAGGSYNGDEYTVLNPTRADAHAGSFSINVRTGMWLDRATDDSGDCVGLYGYLNSLRHIDAARAILELYDPTYSPFDEHKEERDDKKGNYWKGWRCLYKGHRSPPELDTTYFSRLWGEEVERWELRDGKGVLVAVIVRFPNVNGGKEDKPFTLWSDGRETKWRCAGIEGGKYPLYNLPDLLARPNDEFLLTEGQKVASRLVPVVGSDYVPIGWYGGINNLVSTDFEPLRGRQGLFSFDADTAGRSVLKKLKELDVRYLPVYPPVGVAKGWDLADGIRDGWDRVAVLEHLRRDLAPVPAETMALASTRPTNLDTKPSQDLYELVCDSIWEVYTDKEGKERQRLTDDWFIRILNLDAELGNCIKFDYTIGTSSIAYENSNMLEAAIDSRLSEYVGYKFVTTAMINRVIKQLEKRNRNFNRVADYVDMLKQKHAVTGDDLLDEFMSCLSFDIQNETEVDDEEFAKHFDAVVSYYREIFDTFFLRMHIHIHGTRKTAGGEYLGLIENDIVPVLEGGQEKGKTTLCRWLAVEDDLYTDLGSANKNGGAFGSADTVKRVRGRMIAELGEMDIMRTSDDVNRVKSFISAKVYDVDIKFVEKTAPLPSTVSFIGTSNMGEYLVDETGNRRFYPIKIRDIDKDWLARNREKAEKLHAHYARKAECLTREERFSRVRLSDEARTFIEGRRQNAMIRYADHSAVVDVVGKWWAGKSDDYDRMRMCVQDHEIQKMLTDSGYMMRLTHHSVQSGMVELGFEKKVKRDYSGKTRKGWWKIPPKAKEDDTPF